jgi:hypothetical protein
MRFAHAEGRSRRPEPGQLTVIGHSTSRSPASPI